MARLRLEIHRAVVRFDMSVIGSAIQVQMALRDHNAGIAIIRGVIRGNYIIFAMDDDMAFAREDAAGICLRVCREGHRLSGGRIGYDMRRRGRASKTGIVRECFGWIAIS
jgi:hypothetical protein